MSIKMKIITLTALSCALLVGIFMVNILFQEGRAVQNVNEELVALMRMNTKSIVSNVQKQLEATNEMLLSEVSNGLAVSWDVVKKSGGVTLDPTNPVEWEAMNQFDKKVVKVKLPRMLVGEKWLGKNRSLKMASPVVDDVKRLVGGTTTVFQRINEQGDMLRVCTNVEKLDNTRAIGTYIPAVNPDGTDNAVVKTLMSGKTYSGRAYVVNNWYLTEYEPIYDKDRNIIGALYYGIMQEKFESLRKGILNSVVGKTGYIYVLDREGNYVISKGGLRDGENIWNAKDSDGNLFIQSIVNKGIGLKEGEVAYERYPWINKGEKEARMKIAAISYFEPWDWIIGAGTYEDDFMDAKQKMEASINSMVVWGGVIGLIVLAGIVLFSIILSDKITKPIVYLTGAADDISRGNIERTIEVMSKDETGQLTQAFKRMQASLIVLMKRAEKKTQKEDNKVLV